MVKHEAHPQCWVRISAQQRVITKDAKNSAYCCCVRCATKIIQIGDMPLSKTGATHYNTQLELPDKGRAIKKLVFCRTINQKIMPIIYFLFHIFLVLVYFWILYLKGLNNS